MAPRFLKRKYIKNCPFCKTSADPSLKNLDSVKGYVSERGKIISRMRTGLCSKHQRYITTTIKHARHLSLLPFVSQNY